MAQCPSHGWDRYLREQEGPYLVGKAYESMSPHPYRCASCFGLIPEDTPYMRQDMHDDDGFFTSPCRTHMPGECREVSLEEDWNELYR